MRNGGRLPRGGGEWAAAHLPSARPESGELIVQCPLGCARFRGAGRRRRGALVLDPSGDIWADRHDLRGRVLLEHTAVVDGVPLELIHDTVHALHGAQGWELER
eukprot:SAG11_NODE_1759_length_4305_cov_3.542558_2_plen_104_part_00